MEKDINISGVSENLAESIAEQSEIQATKNPVSFLNGKKIAISVSVCEELEFLGLSTQHLDDISIEIARYLIVNGATMLYGGDLRQGGFTRLFSELSYQYKYLSDKERRFVNYFPFPNSKAVTLNDKANFIKQQVEPIILEVPKYLGEIDTEKEYKPFGNVDDRFVYSECFADMRKRMANDCNARIVLGGKQKGYLGYLPGIIEEAYHTLSDKKPIYILGGFGGAARSLAHVILGKQLKELTNEFHYDSEFLKEFRRYSQEKASTPNDFDIICKFFQDNTIEQFSEQNGLSVEENLILFESTNIHELVFLIIKGLKKHFQ
ncbi:MAG TPA: hypothetical protein PKC72_07145 [Chitinophagaceae bacterium]|nr:hypothetical protein [Chitinophagaceae bacterium]